MHQRGKEVSEPTTSSAMGKSNSLVPFRFRDLLRRSVEGAAETAAVEEEDDQLPVFIGVGTRFSHIRPAMHMAFDPPC